MAKKKEEVQANAPEVVETAEQKITRLETELEATLQVNSFLQKELEAATAGPQVKAPAVPGLTTDTFDFDGRKYGFQLPAVILPDTGKITCTEVLASKDLQKQLVELGSGMIKAV
jgi:hypothetical protein